MNFESIKTFGTWMSEMTYWAIDGLINGSANGVAEDSVSEVHAGHHVAELHRGPVYSSLGDALLNGGVGVEIGNGLYM